MKYCIKIFLLLFLAELYVNAQNDVYSPNASSLGLFGQIPVSYYNGLPTIQIPIYQAKGKNLSLPIFLNYHASGVRPNVQVSWVGMNWTLNAGGIITRVIKDKPDETPTYGYSNHSSMGIIFNQFNTPESYLDAYKYNLNSDYDLEPDIFKYQFGGYSGQFFYGEDGELHTHPDNNFIISIQTDSDKLYDEIIITTDRGIKYYFGGQLSDSKHGIEISYDESGTVDEETAWHLIKIEDPNTGEEISLEYESLNEYQGRITKYWYGSYTDYYNYVNLVNIEECSNVKYGVYYEIIEGCAQLSDWNIIHDVGNQEFEYIQRNVISIVDSSPESGIPHNNMVKSRYLSKIITNKEIIVFNRNDANSLLYNTTNSPQKLDSIVIYEKSKYPNEYYKAFDLDYYENVSKRLALKSVTEKGTDNSKQPYVIDYYDASSNNELPGYYTQAIDHWGFYNNHPNANLLPDVTNDYLSREPVSLLNQYYVEISDDDVREIALVGTIKRLTYPTGGYTIFDFEPHDYSRFTDLSETYSTGQVNFIDTETPVFPAGGLRIKKISSFDENDRLSLEKEFIYVKDYISNTEGPSSGVLGGKYTYGNYISHYLDIQYFLGFTEIQGISSSSHSPVMTTNGNHISYSEVVEIIDGGGFNIYKYNGFEEKPDIVASDIEFLKMDYDNNGNPTQYMAVGQDMKDIWCNKAQLSDLDLERGKLLSIETFDIENNLLQEVKYNYRVDESRFSQSSPLVHRTFLPFLGEDYVILSSNKGYYYNYYKTNNSIKKLDNNSNYVEEIIHYDYNSRDQLRKESRFSSDGKEITIFNRYVSDYIDDSGVLDDSDPASLALDFLFELNRISNPIESYTTVGGDNNVISGQILTYRLWPNELGDPADGDIIMPEDVLNYYTNDLNNTYDVSSLNNEGTFNFDDGYETSLSYDSYDTFGNILQYNETDDIDVSYIWGYNKTLPIAKVDNSEYSEINYLDFESGDYINDWYWNNFNYPGPVSEDQKYTGNRSLKIDSDAYRGIVKSIYLGDFDVNGRYFFSARFKNVDFQSTSAPAISIKVYHAGGNSLINEQSVNSGNWDKTTVSVDLSDFTGITGIVLYIQNGISGLPSNEYGEVYVDEIRFHPSDAHMTTYTHDPLIGRTSQTDPNGQTTYYEYDDFGRLVKTRDSDNNIIQEYEYNYGIQ